MSVEELFSTPVDSDTLKELRSNPIRSLANEYNRTIDFGYVRERRHVMLDIFPSLGSLFGEMEQKNRDYVLEIDEDYVCANAIGSVGAPSNDKQSQSSLLLIAERELAKATGDMARMHAQFLLYQAQVAQEVLSNPLERLQTTEGANQVTKAMFSDAKEGEEYYKWAEGVCGEFFNVRARTLALIAEQTLKVPTNRFVKVNVTDMSPRRALMQDMTSYRIFQLRDLYGKARN